MYSRAKDRMMCARRCGRIFAVGEMVYRQRNRFGNKYYCPECYPYGDNERRTDAMKILLTVTGAVATFYVLDAIIQSLV